MKILVIANCPPFDHLGSGYVINHFVIGLKKLGHQVDFFDNRDYPVFTWLKDRALIYRQSIGIRRLVKKRLSKQRYDMIEFWGAEAGLAMEFCKKKHPGIILVHHTNGPEIRYDPLMKHIKKWYHLNLSSYYRKSFSLADCIITVSEDDEFWLKRHFPKKKIYAINPGLPSVFLNLQAVNPKKKIIGFAGNWIKRKGVDLITQDVTLTLRHHRDWKFRIIGGQKDPSILKEFPTDIHPQMELTPFHTTKSDLILDYQELSILIVPSIAESFGLVMAEAMACKAVLIASKVGYAHSLKHENEAMILKDIQPGSLSAAIEQLTDNPGLMARIAENGYHRAQQLDWDTAYIKLNAVYQSLEQCATVADE